MQKWKNQKVPTGTIWLRHHAIFSHHIMHLESRPLRYLLFVRCQSFSDKIYSGQKRLLSQALLPPQKILWVSGLLTEAWHGPLATDSLATDIGHWNFSSDFWHLGDDVTPWFYLNYQLMLKARNQTVTCTDNLKSKTDPTKYPRYNSRTNESYIELPPEKTEPVQFFRSHAPQVVPDALTMRATKGTWIFGIAERSLPMGICHFAVQMMDDQRNAIFKNYWRLLSWCTQNFIKLAGRWSKLESLKKKKHKN